MFFNLCITHVGLNDIFISNLNDFETKNAYIFMITVKMDTRIII